MYLNPEVRRIIALGAISLQVLGYHFTYIGGPGRVQSPGFWGFRVWSFRALVRVKSFELKDLELEDLEF